MEIVEIIKFRFPIKYSYDGYIGWGSNLYKRDDIINDETAELYLRCGIIQSKRIVYNLFGKLPKNKNDALILLVYSTGNRQGLIEKSKIYKSVIEKRYENAANDFWEFCKNPIENRWREYESMLFRLN